MIRWRAGLHAFLTPVLLVASVAQAATIKVTTLADNNVDDALCSVREAVEASRLGSLLLARTGSQARLEDYQETLEAAMAVRLKFDNEYYSRPEILAMVAEMEGELVAEVTEGSPGAAGIDPPATLLADVIALKDAIEDLADNKIYLCSASSTPDCTTLPGYSGGVLPGVTQVHDLILDVIISAGAEIDRIKDRNAKDGCDDGSGFDTVSIPEGVHVLNSQLVLTQRVDFDGVGDASIIEGNGGGRLIYMGSGVAVSIADMQLRNGDAAVGIESCAGEHPFPDESAAAGGAICVRGSLSLNDVLFVNNHASFGGALFVDSFGAVTANRVRFYNNRAEYDGGAVAALNGSLAFTDTVFGCEPLLPLLQPACTVGAGTGTDYANTALNGRGGAIWFNPQTTLNPDVTPYVYQAAAGNLSLDRVLFLGNRADTGSAIATGDATDPSPRFVGNTDTDISIVNTTFGQNVATTAATIAFDPVASTPPGSALLNINNVTLVDNDGGAGTGGIRTTNPVSVVMNNSLLADNVGGGADVDCDLDAGSLDDSNFHRNYYRDNSYPACPGLRQEIDPLYTNYELANGVPAIGYLIDDIVDPGHLYYLPIFPDDYTNLGENRLVARGATTEEPFGCSGKDQRYLDRLTSVDSDCDIGAVEYQVGRRVDDNLEILVSERTCLRVFGRDLDDIGVGNDVGDANYVAGSLRVLAVERPGATAIIASLNNADPVTGSYALAGIPVVDIATCPNIADLAGEEEVILFTPAPGFQGETNITYSLDWIAGGAVTRNGTVQGIAHVRTESRGGFTSDSIGAGSLAWLLLLALTGLRRCRFRAAWVLVPVLGLASPAALALENIIYVNSLADPLVLQTAAGDGQCTLREALETARNDTANPTRGDCVDGNEGPDIIEFTYDPAVNGPVSSTQPLTLTVTLNNYLTAYGGVTIRCPVVEGLSCRILRDITVTPAPFRLIDSLGSITIDNMILEGGDADLDFGGAINSYGAVAIRKSRIVDNNARVGGAIFLRGPSGDLIFSESTFTGNSSTGTTIAEGGGGVLAMRSGTQHKVQISSSTFTGNSSLRQAAALNIKTTSTTVIVNSTFSGNSSTLGSGAIDLTDARATAVLRNVTIVDNASGTDGGIQYYALQVGAGPSQHRLYNSIVAANDNSGGGGVDRNCSDATGVYLGTRFTLFGENPLAPTCPAGATDQVTDAIYVYNGTNAGALLRLLEANGFPYAYTHAPNIPVPSSLPPAVTARVVNAAYNLQATPADNLVSPLDLTSQACADVDQRGISRLAGGRCDRGAHEYNEVTATADVANNRGRHDRLTVSDVLVNDLAEDGKKCEANSYGSTWDGNAYADGVQLPNDTTFPSAPTYNMSAFPDAAPVDETNQAAWAYDNTVRPGGMVICAMVRFDASEGEAFFLPLDPRPTDDRPDRKFVVDGDDWDDEVDTTSQVILAYRDCNEARTVGATQAASEPCNALTPAPYYKGEDWADQIMKNDDARVINYRAGDIDGNFSAGTGDITISVLNVPPWIRADTVYVSPGETVRVNILANDTDYDAFPDPLNPAVHTDPPPLNCTGSLCFNPFHDITEMPDLSPTGMNLKSLKIVGCDEIKDDQDIDNDADTEEVLKYVCQFGDVYVDHTNGVITWIPHNSFNPFSEDISYQVSDYAFPESSDGVATLHIVVDRPDGNGGGLLGDDDLSDMLGIDFLGAGGPWCLLVIGLAAARRRR